jgi:hypothetical protein
LASSAEESALHLGDLGLHIGVRSGLGLDALQFFEFLFLFLEFLLLFGFYFEIDGT